MCKQICHNGSNNSYLKFCEKDISYEMLKLMHDF